jgi:hypothetical protein
MTAPSITRGLREVDRQARRCAYFNRGRDFSLAELWVPEDYFVGTDRNRMIADRSFADRAAID